MTVTNKKRRDHAVRTRRLVATFLWPFVLAAPIAIGGCTPPTSYGYGRSYYPPLPQLTQPAPPQVGDLAVPPQPPAPPAPTPTVRSGGTTSGNSESWSQWLGGGSGPDDKYGWWRINGWLDRMGAPP